MHIENAYRIIPVYTADVSGVCSALYELGSMTVMHDPSGCNSTYNTHDETRWYDKDSLIYISGLTELDAVMGNDGRFVKDVADAALRLHPEFIVICGSPIPFLNGTDFAALARLIEKKTKIPAFAVETNGMHDYVQGAGKALEKIAQRFVREPGQKKRHSVNVLGMTPLDFAAESSASSMRRVLEEEGLTVQSIWAMGDPVGDSRGGLFETMKAAAEAAVNLVVSQTGMPAAKMLEKKFGIPYVAGVPLAPIRKQLITAVLDAEKDGKSRIICNQRSGRINREKGKDGESRIVCNQRSGGANSEKNEGSPKAGMQVILIGEPVTMGSLAAAIQFGYGCDVHLLTPMEKSSELLADGDRMMRSEEALERELRGAVQSFQETDRDATGGKQGRNGMVHVIADPLYKPIVPKDAVFHELPHAAFSGRGYLRRIPDWLMLLD